MIFLCDYYNQASKDLAYSLQAAGYDATTVVINPDGFLPQDALSPSPIMWKQKRKLANHAFSTKFLCQTFGKFQGIIRWRVCLILPKNVLESPSQKGARLVSLKVSNG